MNKIKIVKLNVKKTDKKIYDFNILKLDLNKNNTDKIIDDYIDSFIKEFVEIIDFQYNNISDIILSLVDDLKIKECQEDTTKNLYFENKRFFEDYNFCYACIYQKSNVYEKEDKIHNYLSEIITDSDDIYVDTIILKQNIEKKTFEDITLEDIHNILKNKITPQGIVLNTDYKIAFSNVFYVNDFFNYMIGALSVINKLNCKNQYIDFTGGKLRIAYDFETDNNKKESFEYIKEHSTEDKYYKYLMEFLSYVIPDEIDKIKNCVMMYYYSMNGKDVQYNVSINELCKIIELNYDNIKKGIFQQMNCTNNEKILNFHVFNKIKSITNI